MGVGDDGTVRVRAYVDAIVMGLDDLSGIQAAGHYDDEFIRTTQGWQINRRRFTPVLYQAVP